MEYIMKRPFHWSWNCLKVEKMDWPAPVDMYEKEDNFVMRAELPGMKKEDIDISVTGDMLSIKGDRRPPAEVKDNEYKCSEVCYGRFSRSINIPAAVDAGKIEASYEDGILEIRLPKLKESKPTKIQIKAK